MKKICLLTVMIVIAGGPFWAETFYLKDGTEIEGKIVSKSDTALIIAGENGDVYSLLKTDLAESGGAKDSKSENIPAVTPSNNIDTFKNFSIYVPAGEKFLIGGKWYEDLHNSLTPTPDYFSCLSLGLGIDWYFSKLFGVSLQYDFADAISAESTQASSLMISISSSIKAMILMRIPVYQQGGKAMFIRLFAGPNFSFFDLSGDLKNLLISSAAASGYTISFYTGPATGFGFTGGAGYLYENNNWSYGLDFVVDYKNVEYPGASENIDMLETGLQFRIGYDF